MTELATNGYDATTGAASVAPTLAHTDRVAPLSAMQERIWFLSQLDPEAAFQISIGLRLEGALNPAALESSLNELIRRHESLRSTIELVDDRPMQRIAEQLQLSLPAADLTSIPADQQMTEVQRLVASEAQSPFNLEQGPLVRATLAHLNDAEHVLLLTLHQLVIDRPSLGILIEDLGALYAGATQGASINGSAPAQYSDSVQLEREWLSSAAYSSQLDYWRQRLAGVPVLQLPTKGPRPARQTFRGARHPFALLPDLTQELEALSQQEGSALFMTLLTAFQAVLSRYTGQDDIAVGGPVQIRKGDAFKRSIGCFGNTVVLRAQLADDPSFRDALHRVRATVMEAAANHELPFAHIVEALSPERSLSHTPLFQVMFAMEYTPLPAIEVGGLAVQPFEVDSGTTTLDMSVLVTPTAAGLSGSVEYNTDLFDDAMIARLVGHWTNLLQSAVKNPEQRLSQLPILSADEQQQILVQWNATEQAVLPQRTIHQLFEVQADRTPAAVALVSGGTSLSYAQLNERANQVAHYLSSRGVTAGTLVALYLDRTAEMVVAMVGVLKAGGAYVPLDSAAPPARLAFMLQDTQAPIVLTQERHASLLPESAQLVCLDRDWPALAAHPTGNPQSNVSEDDLAYVIYTSGSTGQPKGVAIEHRNAAAFLSWCQSSFSADELAGVLASTALSFDLSVFELFAPLISGGAAILADNILQLRSLPAADRITLINTVPSALAEVLADVPASVRSICLAGEPLQGSLVARVRQQRPDISIRNLYGPSEATTYATCALIAGDNESSPTIGRPIANTQIYLLDAHMQPVSVGVAGELYIAGAGVARGYLNRPDLTAAAFVENPFSSGERLYKTGDLARYRADGQIEFLGRKDGQIKLRGYRIELGEIEAVLSQHEAVREAVVLLRDERLVAYVVENREQGNKGTREQTASAASPSPPTAGEGDVRRTGSEGLAPKLRSFLATKLPMYMIPTSVVILDGLPLTAHGKIDRQALPEPPDLRSGAQPAFVAPRDALELELAQIGENVLNIQPVGVTDNFFELGGHSLKAVRLMAQIERRFGRRLPLSALFQGSTVKDLANQLREQPDAAPRSPLVRIKSGSKQPFFCIHPAGGNVLCYYHLARHLDDEQPFYGLQPTDLEGDDDPYTSVEELATQYIEAIRTVQPRGPYLLGGWSFGGTVAFEMAQQLLRQKDDVALLALLDTLAPMPFAVEFDDATVLALLTRELAYPHGLDLLISIGDLRKLGPEEQLQHVLEQMHKAQLVTPDVGVGWVRRLLQIYKSSIRVMESYRPQVYPGRVTLFRSSEVSLDDFKFLQEAFQINFGAMGGMPPGMDFSKMGGSMPPGMDFSKMGGMPPGMGGGNMPQGMPPGMPPDMGGGNMPQGMPPGMDFSAMGGSMPPGMDFSAMGGGDGSLSWMNDPALGWTPYAGQPIDIQEVPGGHLTFVAEPHVRLMAERLSAMLDQAQANPQKGVMSDGNGNQAPTGDERQNLEYGDNHPYSQRIGSADLESAD